MCDTVCCRGNVTKGCRGGGAGIHDEVGSPITVFTFIPPPSFFRTQFAASTGVGVCV